MTPERLFDVPYRSPQLPLWEPGDDGWLPELRLPADAPRRPRPVGVVQPPRFQQEGGDS